MALDIIVLSVLRAGPVHGYELKRRAQRPTLATLSNNSLYPLLRRFEEAGAVTRTLEEQPGRPSRKVYAITDAGRELLTTLVRALPPELAGNEEEFLVRLSFFDEITPADRQAILAARAAVLSTGAVQVRALLGDAAAASRPAWRDAAMRRRLEQLEGELAWIDQLQKKAQLQTKPQPEKKAETPNHG